MSQKRKKIIFKGKELLPIKKMRELQPRMRVCGCGVNLKGEIFKIAFTGKVHSVSGGDANVLRDDGENGGGEMVPEYGNTWHIAWNSRKSVWYDGDKHIYQLIERIDNWKDILRR